MSASLPLRANLEWLKKLCKDRLADMRKVDSEPKLSDAQLVVAREFGFPSWRKLKEHVQLLRQELGKLARAGVDDAIALPDDSELQQLMSAITAGDQSRLVNLLEHRPILARSVDANGQTPLHLAARFNDPTLCVWLLAYGADPTAKFGQSGHTVLSWATTCNASEFAAALVRLSGIKPDLFCAAGLGLLDAVRAHFDSAGNLLPGASQTGSSRFAADGSRLPCPPASPREQISDALCMACRNSHLEAAKFLLSKQPDLAFRGYLGGTPLHWAYFGGAMSVVDALLQAGADPAARDDFLQCTPRAFGVAIAANWGFDFIVRKLLAADPALANAVDNHTCPLYEAARSGHVEVVKLLLERGADPTFRNGSGLTAVEIAEQSNHMAVVELLKSARI